MSTSILRLKQVQAKTGLSRSEIIRRESHGLFPKKIKLGSRSVGWVAEEIDEWLMEIIRQNRSGKVSIEQKKHDSTGRFVS